MTREEAIQWLKAINTRDFCWDEYAMQESQREIRERCEECIREALNMATEALQTDLVRCKDCMHRHEYECPMYHEEWFTIDEGDGYVDDDYNVIDKTDDDGFCNCGERREE